MVLRRLSRGTVGSGGRAGQAAAEQAPLAAKAEARLDAVRLERGVHFALGVGAAAEGGPPEVPCEDGRLGESGVVGEMHADRLPLALRWSKEPNEATPDAMSRSRALLGSHLLIMERAWRQGGQVRDSASKAAAISLHSSCTSGMSLHRKAVMVSVSIAWHACCMQSSAGRLEEAAPTRCMRSS